MADHTTRVVWQAGWREWRPECSCGWIGSYWQIERLAHREANRHRQEAAK